MVKNFKVGQKIYQDILGKQEGQWLTIETVGRVWLTMTSGVRVHIVDMTVDNQGIGWKEKCYLTYEICQELEMTRRIWDKIRNEIKFRAPDISLDESKIIAKMLNINIGE